jgi:hypothetical protein
MFSRFVSGLFHPLIHTGYGLEFGINGMLAEGIYLCTHASYPKFMFPSQV